MDAHFSTRRFTEGNFAVEPQNSGDIEKLNNYLILSLTSLFSFNHTYDTSCAIEMINEVLIIWLPIIYKIRLEIIIPIKDIFLARSNELFNQIITIRPNNISSLDKVCFILSGISFIMKFLNFRRLINLIHLQVINPLCV